MTILLALLPMLFGVAPGGFVVRSIMVEDRIVMRVPVRPPSKVQWSERKGPKCIRSRAIRGAFLEGDDHVDFLLAGGRHLRAALDENCPALDFYGGFYLSSSDRRICAGRDVVRSRAGASCAIDRFRLLVPRHP